MRELPYDYDIVYETSYLMIKSDYENMPEEWYIKKAKENIPRLMIQIFKGNIWYRLQQEGADIQFANRLSQKLIEDVPKELYQNIQEWIDEKPISDIKYGGISIKDIMEQDFVGMGIYHSFIESLMALLLYIEHGCKDKTLCKNYFKKP